MYTYRLLGTLENLDPLTPDLWEAGCQGLTEDNGTVLAYFDAPLELPFGGTWVKADDTDWIAAYRASLEVVTIGKVTITPPWLESPQTSQIQLLLEPGLAFGTGQHQTTQMAILALQEHDLKTLKVLDVGAGTGILAMVAAKLGAAAVYGVDNDPSTVAVALENAAQNKVEIEFRAGLLEDMLPQAPFDLIVANLFAELHELLMPQYKQALTPNGRLILTGILAGTEQADAGEKIAWDSSSGRETLVLEALATHGFGLRQRRQLADWVLLEATL